MDLDGRCFIKRGNTLVPADFAADELLAGIKEGREIIVTIRRARSPQHHRWFFALLRKICDNTEMWKSEEELLDALKIETGHVERRMTLNGQIYLAPKSISFAAMAQDLFREWSTKALNLLAPVIGVAPETLMNEVNDTQRKHHDRT